MYDYKSIFSNYGLSRLFFYLGLLTICQTVLRPMLSFTLSDWFFFISFILAAIERSIRRRKKICFPPYLIAGLFFFSLGGIISSGLSQTPIPSFIAFLKYFYLIAIWFWLGMILLQRPEHIKISIILWTVSAAVSSSGALVQLIWGDVIPGINPAWGRVTGFTEHVNDLAGVASVAFVPALMMVAQEGINIRRLLSTNIIFLLIIFGLILSVSISGLLAVLTSLILWLVLTKSPFKKIIVASIVFIFILVAITFQSRYIEISIITRLRDISADREHYITLSSRIETYKAAWTNICKNPLIGVGIGTTSGITNTGKVVHNILLSSWFEAGFFGFIGMLMILFSIFLTCINLIKCSNSSKEQNLSICLFASYIAFLTLGMSQAIYYQRYGWISAALLISLYSVRSRIAGREIGRSNLTRDRLIAKGQC